MAALLVIIRLFISVTLLIVGSLWLTYTVNVENLILNAVALEFVLEVDIMLFALAPSQVPNILKTVPSTPKILQYKKNPARNSFRKNYKKIFLSVDPESGHSCLVFVQYPRDSPRSAWELQKKSAPQRIPVKITKKKYKKKTGGEFICKKFGVNGTRRESTICSKFTTRSDSLPKM